MKRKEEELNRPRLKSTQNLKLTACFHSVKMMVVNRTQPMKVMQYYHLEFYNNLNPL